MGFLTLLRAGAGGNVGGATSETPAQMQFFENFPGHLGQAFNAYSQNTLSFHAVNIPLHLSLNSPVVLLSNGAAAGDRQLSVSFGLYSLNLGTLSLANSGSGSSSWSNAEANIAWLSLTTSAAQNITPGAWYLALNLSSANGAGGGISIYGNSTISPLNALPGGFLMGRVTASTGAMPASIATSVLDTTADDAVRQSYIIITA